MILVLNAGSSSIKFALFRRDLTEVLRGAADGIGGAGRLVVDGRAQSLRLDDHDAALGAALAALPDRALVAVGHRVVHGGARLTAPARISPEVERLIDEAAALAPLHNPVALRAMRAVAARLADLPQVGVFDTAFHATVPEVAQRYALPDPAHRRFGFHGISYAGLVEALRPDLPQRLLALHLGNGASLCAIRDGQSVATTMGYSPLSGLTMGTRSGDVDPGLVLHLARLHGIDGADRLLNGESGLTALAGENDMAALLARDDAQARFAVAHFCYWAARHAGSMAVAMGGVDAIAFTGGIGEHAAPVRQAILAHLRFLGDLPVHVVPAREERQIAREVLSLL